VISSLARPYLAVAGARFRLLSAALLFAGSILIVVAVASAVDDSRHCHCATLSDASNPSDPPTTAVISSRAIAILRSRSDGRARGRVTVLSIPPA